MPTISELNTLLNPSSLGYILEVEENLTYKLPIGNIPLLISATSGSSGSTGSSGTSSFDGSSGSSGSTGSSGYSGLSELSGLSGTNGINGLSGQNAVIPISIYEPFSEQLIFNHDKYYENYTQTSSLNFSMISGNTIMSTIFSKIYVDARYSINFGDDFISYHNELSNGTGIYDFWFARTPNNIVYSITKTGEYIPEIDIIPYSGDTIARYCPFNLTLDPTSEKITQINNIFNTGLTLTSITDSKRPLFDGDNNRIIINSTGVTENLNGTTTIELTPNNTWYVAIMAELNVQRIGSTDKPASLIQKPSAHMMRFYNTAEQHYLNGTLLNVSANDIILKRLGGVHIFSINQTVTGTELYIDNVLVGSNTTLSTSGLTLSNIFSAYNSTTSQITNIKYIYDSLFYNRSMNSTERDDIKQFFVTKHPIYNPDNIGVLSNYMTTDLVTGSTLHSGSTIAVSFTYSGATSGSIPTEIVTILKQGGGTLKTLIHSTNITIISQTGNTFTCTGIITLPGGLTATTLYYTSSYILDQNGLYSNNQDYTTIKFTYA